MATFGPIPTPQGYKTPLGTYRWEGDGYCYVDWMVSTGHVINYGVTRADTRPAGTLTQRYLARMFPPIAAPLT